MARPPGDDLSQRIRAPQIWYSLATPESRRMAVAVGVVIFAGAVVVLRLSTTRDRAFEAEARQFRFPKPPDTEAAITAALERLKGNPQDISALVKLGTLHFELGKAYYPQAINSLEDARELGALDPRIFYCLGLMYQESGLFEFALTEYRRFLRHYPEDKEIRLLAAKLFYKGGRFKEAVSEYERLKFHHPQDALIKENLGLSLWGAKTVDRAVETFRGLKGQGGLAGKRAAFYMGQIAYEQGRYHASLEHLLSSLPLGDEKLGLVPEKMYAALALTYQKLDRGDEARKAWKRVLDHSPQDAKAKAALKKINRRASKARKRRPSRKGRSFPATSRNGTARKS